MVPLSLWVRCCAAVADIRGAPPAFPAPALKTQVKVIYDDTHVYVATKLVENHVWATYTQKDSRGESRLGLWMDG